MEKRIVPNSLVVLLLTLCVGTILAAPKKEMPKEDVGANIREAQYKTFLDFYKAGDKNIGYTSTFDLNRRWYHPQLKVPAGERIARWA